MNKVNPPTQLVLPRKIQEDKELKKALDDRDYILFQLWQRTGAGADLVYGNSTIGYEFDELASIIKSFLPKEDDVKVTSIDYTTIGNQTVICIAASTIYLNAEPKDRERAKVVITNGDVTVNGNGKLLNKKTTQTVIFRNLITTATLDIIYVLDTDEWFIV